MKKNLILSIILVILLALAAAYQYWYLPRVNNSTQENNFLAKIDIVKADKIVIKRGEIETTLIKEGDRFKVQAPGEWYVNKLVAQTMIQSWQTADSGTVFLVSHNKDAKPEFKTDGGLVVKIFQGNNQQGAWVLGLTRAGYTYISHVGSDDTYEVQGNLRSAFDYQEWRDFAIWPPATGAFTALKISRGKDVLQLQKQGADWFLSGDKKTKLKLDKLNQVLALMSDLSASSIADAKETDNGLASSQFKIEASGQGINRLLLIGKERKDKSASEVYVKTNQNNNVYLIRTQERDIFNLSLKDLR